MKSDLECTVCEKSLNPFRETVESYQLVKWNPETKSNELVAVFCLQCAPIVGV